MIEIFVYGQRYEVPEGLTILQAFEWAGYRLTRGVGCRGGFCGACSTTYRIMGDYKLHFSLACQSVVEPGMLLGQIPFFPARRPDYSLQDLKASAETLLELFPELVRCFGCNTCTKSCPQELDVLSYMSAALRGDLPALANESFDCINCGLCTARCPAELVPPNVSLIGRRLYGKYIAPTAAHLHQRIRDVEAGLYREELSQLKLLPLAELKKRYEARQIEA
jgi:ferredoxin